MVVSLTEAISRIHYRPKPVINSVAISTVPPAGWDEFVDHQKNASFEQYSWWSAAEATDGWDSIYAVQRETGNIVTGVMILTRYRKKIGRIGYVFRGPLGTESEACTLLREAARSARLRFLIVVPPYDGANFSQHALRRGFLLHPSFLPPLRLPQATVAVDLKRSPELIEKSFRRSTRQEITAGRKAGIVVEKGRAVEITDFWQLHEDLCRRRNVRSNIPSLAYVQAFWPEFANHDRAWMFKVKYGEELLCALICLRVGSICYAWRIGWNGTHADKYPTKVLYAEAIRHATEAGCERFDFMEIDPNVVAQLQRGEKPQGRDAGVSIFKLGFSGNVYALPPTLIWFPNSVVRIIFRRIAFPLLRNVPIRNFLLRRTSG